METIAPIALEDILAARDRLAGTAIHTPLIRLEADSGEVEIFLKLEILQPIGSFKVRGAGNAMLLAGREALARGAWTVSAGNMGQGVAWCARRLGIPCTVVVPEQTPLTKLNALSRFGARVIPLPYAAWLNVFETRRLDGVDGVFVHPFSDRVVMSGNGTIGLEVLEDLPDVDAVVIPYGGGGLCCGIASALRELKPEVLVYAAEVDTAAPLSASLAAGTPVRVERTPSFVDGIGAPLVFPEMWPLASMLVNGSIVVGLAEVTAALRILAERHHVIAEGAGAAPVAAALKGIARGKIVCIVSGGNIDTAVLTRILAGAPV
jgi:threonine dehydratase